MISTVDVGEERNDWTDGWSQGVMDRVVERRRNRVRWYSGVRVVRTGLVGGCGSE